MTPYGSWKSPISAAAIAAGGLRLSGVQISGDEVYWIEGRPREGGRSVLMRWRPDGTLAEVSPPGFNVRTRVHEYGGGAYLAHGGRAYGCNFLDQRVYRFDDDAAPEPLTAAGCFYADFEIDPWHDRLICVREDHTQEGVEPVNTIIEIPLDPKSRQQWPAGRVLTNGADFYSTPRLSPDGSRLAWLSWRHPRMPWDGTELWVADVDASGVLVNAAQVAGGDTESIYQPGWSPDGTLHYVSDRDGWWKLYTSRGPVVANAPADAEFGRPQWVFRTSTWGFANPSRIVVVYARKGRWRLGLVEALSGTLTDLVPEIQPHEWIATTPTHVVCVAGFDARPDAVVRVELSSGSIETLRQASDLELDGGYVSTAEPIEFPTSSGRTAHAFYYAPRNKDCIAPDGEEPPLLVISHGGPTAAASPTFNLSIQYWTSRGFAVADVNYGGSSGYGRPFRERLNGRWGVVDVEDVINAARYLSGWSPLDEPSDSERSLRTVREGDRRAARADVRRLIIRGGSAGGYTTLAALAFHPGVFQAGASYYGVSDLEVLAADTHKFESRYLEGLIGPFPAARDLYRARSPIHFADQLSCPLILFQGLEDKVVPPSQSQMMAEAVRTKGLPVAYLAFEGEQHGFRKAETIVRCLEAEMYFYGSVFGFTPADAIEPVPVSFM